MSKPIKYGIVVNKFDDTPNHRMIVNSINTSLGKNISLYCSEQTPLSTECNFAIFNHQELFTFSGCAIATNFKTARKVLQLPSAKPKILYLFHLDWVYLNYSKFYDLQEIYDNDELKIITSSEPDFHTYSNIWRTPLAHIAQFDLNKIIEIIELKL